MEKFKKMLPSILMIVFEVAVGILLLIDAEKFTIVTFVIFGCILVLSALAMVMRFLRDRKALNNYEKAKAKVADAAPGASRKISYVPLIAAIITAALGAVFIFGAKALFGVTTLLLIFYGAIMLIKGLIKIVDFFAQRKAGQGVSILHLVSGIISIAFGLLMMIFPASSRDVAFTIGAISLLVEAAIDILALSLSVRLANKIEKAVVEAKASEREDAYDLDNFAE